MGRPPPLLGQNPNLNCFFHPWVRMKEYISWLAQVIMTLDTSVLHNMMMMMRNMMTERMMAIDMLVLMMMMRVIVIMMLLLLLPAADDDDRGDDDFVNGDNPNDDGHCNDNMWQIKLP